MRGHGSLSRIEKGHSRYHKRFSPLILAGERIAIAKTLTAQAVILMALSSPARRLLVHRGGYSAFALIIGNHLRIRVIGQTIKIEISNTGRCPTQKLLPDTQVLSVDLTIDIGVAWACWLRRQNPIQ
jgi:hypothetical protein